MSSISDILGLNENIEEAKKAIEELLEKAAPLLDHVEDRVSNILHDVLDRLNGVEVTLKVTIPPKA